VESLGDVEDEVEIPAAQFFERVLVRFNHHHRVPLSRASRTAFTVSIVSHSAYRSLVRPVEMGACCALLSETWTEEDGDGETTAAGMLACGRSMFRENRLPLHIVDECDCQRRMGSCGTKESRTSPELLNKRIFADKYTDLLITVKKKCSASSSEPLLDSPTIIADTRRSIIAARSSSTSNAGDDDRPPPTRRRRTPATSSDGHRSLVAPAPRRRPESVSRSERRRGRRRREGSLRTSRRRRWKRRGTAEKCAKESVNEDLAGSEQCQVFVETDAELLGEYRVGRFPKAWSLRTTRRHPHAPGREARVGNDVGHLNSGIPLCRVPKKSPGPRSSRSIFRDPEPVRRGHHGGEPAFRPPAFFVSARERPGPPARPPGDPLLRHKDASKDWSGPSLPAAELVELRQSEPFRRPR